MREWIVIFAHGPEQNAKPETWEKGELGPEALKRFDDAATAEELGGRGVFGMWILDIHTEQEDVVKCWGRASHEIHIRHNAYKERLGKLEK